MKTNKYTVDYFIKKLGAIPDDLWTVNVFIDDSGRCCAMGHCGDRSGIIAPPEARALRAMLLNDDPGITGATIINDGEDPRYQQPTPKARILAALRDLKKKQEN